MHLVYSLRYIHVYIIQTCTCTLGGGGGGHSTVDKIDCILRSLPLHCIIVLNGVHVVSTPSSLSLSIIILLKVKKRHFK